MNPTLVLFLLILAFILPVVGAATLRLLMPRLTARQFYGGAALIFAIAVASVLLLSRSQISDVRVAGLTLVLPVSGLDSSDLNLQGLGLVPPDAANINATTAPDTAPTTGVGVAPTTEPTEIIALTAEPSAMPEPTAVPTAEPTAVPATLVVVEPTAVPPTETPVPPTEPPPAPAERRTYIVKKGDTLRSIAAEYDVSVDDLLRVNNLTRAQGDSLRIDQELIIP